MQVDELLREKRVPFTESGQDFLVRCLNPEHDDSHPSMRIDKVTGIFNCFACGFKGNVFYFYGETSSLFDVKKELLKRKIQNKRQASISLNLPNTAQKYLGNWRGIRAETYARFEAFQASESDFVGRLCFPIKSLSEKTVCFLGRNFTDEKPKYKVVPSKVKMPLFPKSKPFHGTMVLVEGIFDVLNLYDKGMENVVCCFGTNQVTADKLELLKIQGVEELIIFFDGDDAGQKASQTVKKLCQQVNLPFKNLYMEGHDPGELTQTQVKTLIRKLYHENSTS
jgi:DNA primase